MTLPLAAGFYLLIRKYKFSKLILLRINLDKRARHLGRSSRLSLYAKTSKSISL
jgi:hypothetical protein